MSVDFSINERIIELINSKGINPLQFSESLGYKRPDTIYNIENKKTGVSLKILIDVCNKYKDVSIEWLLLGEGPMLKSSKPIDETGKSDVGESENTAKIASLNISLEEKTKMIAVQEKYIAKLENELKGLEEQNKMTSHAIKK